MKFPIPVLMLALLVPAVFLSPSARSQSSQGAPPQHQGHYNLFKKKPAPQPVDWQSFPSPDTALLGPEARTPTTTDSLAEIVLDDRGVNFGRDGTIAVTSWRVYLPKSRAGAAQLASLPAAPDSPGSATFAYLFHPDGGVEKASKVSGGVATFARVLPGDLVYIGIQYSQSPSRAGQPGDFFLALALRDKFPVRDTRVWIRYPEGRPPTARGLALPPADSSASGGMVLKQWRLKDLDSMRPERESVAAYEGQPALFVDSHSDPDWLVSICRGFLKLPAGPRLKALAATIRRQSPGRLEQLGSARAFVALRIAAAARESFASDSLRRLTPEGALLRGRAGGYGKTVLLAALLRELGFEPAIALVEPRRLWSGIPAISPDLVSPVVALPAGSPKMWLDPTSFSADAVRPSIALQGLEAVVVGPRPSAVRALIPIGRGAGRGMNANFTGIVDPGGVVAGDVRVTLLGDDGDLWRSALQTGTIAMASEALQALSRQLLFTAETGDARGQNFEAPADSVTLTSTFRARDLLDRSGDSLSLHLPSRLIPELDPPPRSQTRGLIRYYGEHRVVMDLELPHGWSALHDLDTTSATGRYLAWIDSRSIHAGRLRLVRSVSVLKTAIPAAEYADYLAEEKAMNLAFDRSVPFRAAR